MVTTDGKNSNVVAIGDKAAEPDEALVENLRRLLTMAETGVLRWLYAVGQTSNRCEVVHCGGSPVDTRAAYIALEAAYCKLSQEV